MQPKPSAIRCRMLSEKARQMRARKAMARSNLTAAAQTT
jgi:hypothetical protein